jgi:hypothetical protein
MYPGNNTEKPEKWLGKLLCAAAGALAFHFVCVSRSPPPALEVTEDIDKEERRAKRSGNDLGAGSTGCYGGVDKRVREEVFLASLFPFIFGKTEVLRDLD